MLTEYWFYVSKESQVYSEEEGTENVYYREYKMSFYLENKR